MRNKILVLAALAVLFVGCESSRERFVKQFSEACQYNPNFDGANADIFCVCMAEFYASQFSDKELDLMKKFESPFYQPQYTRYFIPILKEIYLDIDSYEEASLNFMMRLYFTNKVGHTLPADFTEGVDMNEVASSIKAYATNKGFIKEIDNIVTGVAKCMNDLGVIDILDDSILNEAYKCVDELC